MGKRGRVTELTLSPWIKEVFEEHGARAVPEIKYVTMPDFIVEWLGELWIVSVKIGDPRQPRLFKNAFIQYTGHMIDTGIRYGMIIFYPEEIKRIRVSPEVIRKSVKSEQVYVVVLNPQMEFRKPLPEALSEIEETLRIKIPRVFSLGTVVNLLRAQIEDIMSELYLEESQAKKIIPDPELFFGLNPVRGDRKNILSRALRFLAAYIFLSQVLFLRLYCEERPTFIEGVNVWGVGRDDVRNLFKRIKEVNYKPIFDIDVLDLIHERLIRETFRLLFGLHVRGIRYELPGRLFHELMPRPIRKLLAAFYTRPIAAYLLALLTIDDASATVFDPACGSGTILTMAYRRKLELWRMSGAVENPHKLFCERHIYGGDIMPFAVHLTNANLAAMDPLTTIDLTQVILGDSLKLAPTTKVKPGFMTLLEFIPGGKEVKVKAFTRTGEPVEVTLNPVKVILMNPPFTKVERGVRKYIDMGRFEEVVGKEVGLWGHFVALADIFLEDGGVFGAILPINLLRGRESEKVRKKIFVDWLPLYVIKASKNYGFTEYAEYRDVIVVARKTRIKSRDHKVKFCIIKKDLNKLGDDEVRLIADYIKNVDNLRSPLLDIDSHPLSEVLQNFDSMMPFISSPSLEVKDRLRAVISKAERLFHQFPKDYFAEGYGPRPEGVSGFMFVTRPISRGRTEKAFLIPESELKNEIIVKTSLGVQKFTLNKKHFLPSLRTPVGLNKLDVTNIHDYVAKEPYEDIDKIMSLSGFKGKLPDDYWTRYIASEFKRSTSNVTVVCRVNPYSPEQKLFAYYSSKPLVLADLFHPIREKREDYAKAITVLLNSVFFLAYFFNMKEETTGRYMHIRHSDLYKMRLYPSDEQVKRLVEVYEKYKDVEFPALREQLDMHFNERYEWFWARERGQETLTEPPPIKPHPLRLAFDLDVISAVGSDLELQDLLDVYEAIVLDIIVTRGLRKD